MAKKFNIKKIGDKFKIHFNKWSEVEIPEAQIPEAKLKKWGDECFIKIRFPDFHPVSPIQHEGKLKWKNTDKEVHLYPLEPREFEENGHIFKQLKQGGFEFEVIQKKKPATPEIVLDIEIQGVKFFPPQPDERNKEGVLQPENVVGSIPVYHATRGNMHPSKGEAEKYKISKFGHFYYPYLEDSNGWKVRAESFKIENGKMKVKMPDDFWNNAVYPVRHSAGATFGYSNKGGSSNFYKDEILLGVTSNPGENGVATSISCANWRYSSDYPGNAKCAIYAKTGEGDGDFERGTEEKATNDTQDFETYNLTSPSGVSDEDYYLVFWMSNHTYIAYDIGSNLPNRIINQVYNNWPGSIDAAGYSTQNNSIYCTYTPGAVTYRKDLSSKGNVLRTYRQNLQSKGEIKAEIYRQNLQSKGNLWKPELKDLNSKGNTWKTQQKNLQGQAYIQIEAIYQKDLQSKGNVVLSQQKDLQNKGYIQTPTYQQDLKSKGNIKEKPWLSDWGKRIKLIIDHDDIDAALSNFPILVYLSADSGRLGKDVSCVFDELQADANRKKIAVTKSDGVTQCYVEIEKWDDVNEKAWLWVKVPSISNIEDTDLYLYYDASKDDNIAYVGDPSDAVVHNVWDSNFKLVTHMRDDPDTSHIRDSTVNANDGAKGAANEPNQVDAKIGKGQDFEHTTDDLINCGSDPSIDDLGVLTLEYWYNVESGANAWPYHISQRNATYTWIALSNAETDIEFVYLTNLQRVESLADWSPTFGTWYHVVITYDDGGDRKARIYINGVEVSYTTQTPGTGIRVSAPTIAITIGNKETGERGLDGKMDEVRISNIVRGTAWIKASYESERDDLLDFGSEEALAVKKDLKSQGHIKVAVTYRRDLSSKADLFLRLWKDLESEADIWKVEHQDLKTRGYIALRVQKDLKTQGSISVTKYKDLESRTNLVRSQQKDLLSKANIIAVTRKDLENEGNILAVIRQDLKSRGDLFTRQWKNLETEADILVRTRRDLESKTWIKVPEIEAGLNSRANIVRLYQQDLGTKGNIWKLIRKNLSSEASVFLRLSQDLKSRASIKAVVFASLETKANVARITAFVLETLGNIWEIVLQDLESRAVLFIRYRKDLKNKASVWRVVFQGLTSGGSIRVPVIQQILESKANIAAETFQKYLSSKASLYHIVPTELVSPVDEAIVPDPITLVWKIPSDSLNRNISVHVQVDKTSASFQDLEAEKLSYRDSGFEYWNGSEWVAYPAGGVGSAYYGNQARILIPLTGGAKYWRVKGCA